ncbi:hypothetical protein JTE90_017930 [Oedothorax gibbosus]|uniref:Uncharacterized protein n=1 Tax=Oedothorax gibbosus TaxID=931172 RepID=A0AAV6TPR3_9ARAC|nr:hypothetical protein JTE90_017930 [Oedothorax gibbosus]
MQKSAPGSVIKSHSKSLLCEFLLETVDKFERAYCCIYSSKMLFEERFEETSLGSLNEMKIRSGKCAHNNNNLAPCIKHPLRPDDTLQGLALLYGVSVSIHATLSQNLNTPPWSK